MTDLIALAKQAGGVSYTSRHFPDSTYSTFRPDSLQAFADLIAAREREACALICERISPPESFTLDFASWMVIGTQHCAAVIRARTTT